MKGEPKVETSAFGVDLAFGPAHGNDVIYKAAVLPLVDLALQVNFMCVFQSVFLL